MWSAATALLAFAAGDVIAHTTGVIGPRVIDENPIDLHVRASQRAQGDAHRCSGELRVLAVRHPGVTVRVLEIDPELIKQSRGRPGGLAAVAIETIDVRVAAVETAAREIARLQASPGSSGEALAGARDLSGHAHRISARLCEAREAISAATLAPPPR